MGVSSLRHSLKTKLSLAIALTCLLTVALISFSSNFFIERQFAEYKIKQQEKNTDEIVKTISGQYNKTTGKWDIDFVHAIGMTALNSGYIIKVNDTTGNTVWDAEQCDMASCHQVMNDTTSLMKQQYPKSNGEFTSKTLDINQDNEKIGSVVIQYFGPYFFSEDDFSFLGALNIILVCVGIVSLLISFLIGFLFAKRISRPILKTASAAKQISDGEYSARIHEKTNTAEVVQLMNSVNQLAESLEKQENLRKQLTADVSHELRTPLTTVQTHLEAMLEGVWQPTPERLQSCYDEIVRIGKMMYDLENLAKVDSDDLKLNITKVNLREITKKVLTILEAEEMKKDLHISIDGNDTFFRADRDRINQVIFNLVSNAIKYTPNGGKICIIFSESKKSVTFSIKDDGIGIGQEDLPFIFERFYRADKSRNRMTGGSGIGLAVVKSIVTAHGGKVSVLSKMNEGTVFNVEFPK